MAAAPTAKGLPDLGLFYSVTAADTRLEELAENLLAQDLVEAAYVKPAATVLNKSLDDAPSRSTPCCPRPERRPTPATPDFTANQLYLEPAPGASTRGTLDLARVAAA